MKLVYESVGLLTGTRHGFVVEPLPVWVSDSESGELKFGLVADLWLTVPFVVLSYAEFLGYAGAECSYIPARHFELVEYWTENFVARSVGCLVELTSVGYKVLVWRRSDQNADLRD